MKKPEYPTIPIKNNFLPKHKETIFIDKIFVYPDSYGSADYFESEEFKQEREEENDNAYIDDRSKLKVENWEYDNDVISLDKLLKIIGSEDPKNIFISLHRDRQCMHVEFVVSKRDKFDAKFIKEWKAENKRLKNEWEEKMKQYHIDMLEYEIWCKEQEAQELKNKLANAVPHKIVDY